MDFTDEDPIYDSYLYKDVISHRKQRKKLFFISLGLILLNLILGTVVFIVKTTERNNMINENFEEDVESETNSPTSSFTAVNLEINDLDLSQFETESFSLLQLLCREVEQPSPDIDSDEIFVTCFQDQPLFCSRGNRITLQGCPVGTACSCVPGLPLSVENNPDPSDLCTPLGQVNEDGRTSCPARPLDKLSFRFSSSTDKRM